jgi:hypothetical protein
MEQDMSTRPWRCEHCGQRVLSKHPGMRSVFPAPRDWVVSVLRNISLVDVVDDPSRPAGVEMTPDWGRTSGAAAEAGQDLQIRVTVDNQRFPWTEEKDVQTPRDGLARYVRLLRECTPEQVEQYICGVVDGHRWIDEKLEKEGEHAG